MSHGDHGAAYILYRYPEKYLATRVYKIVGDQVARKISGYLYKNVGADVVTVTFSQDIGFG